MVGRVGVEPTSPVFQTGAVTTLATAPSNLERETGFEPAASSLARRRSTTELFPQTLVYYNKECGGNRKDFRHHLPLNSIHLEHCRQVLQKKCTFGILQSSPAYLLPPCTNHFSKRTARLFEGKTSRSEYSFLHRYQMIHEEFDQFQFAYLQTGKATHRLENLS